MMCVPPIRRRAHFLSITRREDRPVDSQASRRGFQDRHRPSGCGPIWDGFWMLSALWLAPIIFWLAHGYSDPESSPLDLFYFALTALFWIGHRLCSTYLAYCTEAYRPLLRSQPIRFVLIPIFVTVACFAIFLPADSALPWTREERL